eukprot:gene14135-18964_t
MATTLQQRFASLKSKLSGLGGHYDLPFNIDSLDLVDHLLNDLVATTNSYRQVQDKESRLSSDLALAQAQLFPLRKENARLSRETNQLHLDHVSLIEENKTKLSSYEFKIRKLENDLIEIKLLSEAKDEQLLLKDQQIDHIREAYESVSDSMGKKRGIPVRSVMKVTNTLAPNAIENNHVLAVSSVAQSSNDALLIQSLRQQVENLQNSLHDSQQESSHLKSSLVQQENVLSRYSNMLNNSNEELISTFGTSRAEQIQSADMANKRIIDQLNGQVDFLNEQLALREAQLVELNEKRSEYENYQMELSNRKLLLDQYRQENQDLASRTIELEHKLQGKLLVSSKASHRKNNKQSMEVKESTDSDSEDPHQEKSNLLIYKLSSERNDLVAEVERLRSVIASMRIKGIPLPQNTIIKKKTGLALTKKSYAQSSNSKINSSKEHNYSSSPVQQEESLIYDLNQEIELNRQKLKLLTQTLVSKDEQIALLMDDRDKKQKQINDFINASNPKEKQRMASLVSELQEKNIQNELNNSEFEHHKRLFELKLSSLSEENEKLKLSLQNYEIAGEDQDMKAMIMGKELDILRQTNAQILADLSGQRFTTSSIQSKLDDKISELQRETARSENYKAVIDKLRLDYESKIEEVDEFRYRLESIKQDNQIAKESSMVEQLKSDIHNMQYLIQQLEEERISWNNERKSLQNILSSFSTQLMQDSVNAPSSIHNSARAVKELLFQKDQAYNKLNKEFHDCRQENQRLTNMIHEIESMNELSKVELNEYKSKSDDQTRLIDQQFSDLKLLQSRFNDYILSSNEEKVEIDAKNETLQSLTRQLKQTKEELFAINSKYNSTIQSKEKIEQQYHFLKQQYDHLQQKNTQYQQNSQQSINERMELEEKNQELILLIQTMETNSAVIQEKYISYQQELNNEEKNRLELNKTISESQKTIKKLENKSREYQLIVENLDRDRDSLHDQLDKLEEELSNAQAISHKNDELINQLQQIVTHSEKKIKQLENDINSLNKQKSLVEAKINSLQIENSQYKKTISHKQGEVAHASEDILLMTKENQALTSELCDVTAERDNHVKKMNELSQTIHRIQHEKHAIEIEKSDLLDTYRALLQEKRKLEADMKSINLSKQEQSANVYQIHEQNKDLQLQIDAYVQAKNNWVNEKSSLSLQLERMNDELVREQQVMDDVRTDNRKLLQDCYSLRQTNEMLNERVNLMIKRAAAASDANKVLSSRLSAVERERDSIRALVAVERQRATEMVAIAEAARSQTATKDMQLQRLRSLYSSASPSPSPPSQQPQQAADDMLLENNPNLNYDFVK